MTKEKYPDFCLKGITNEKHIDECGSISNEAFRWDESKNNLGYNESSINWMDNEDVIKITLNQKNADGSFHFKAGVAKLSKSQIDRCINLNTIERISYERRPVEDNKYHGNLLLKKDLDKSTKNRLIAQIILSQEEFIPQQKDD